MLIAGGFLGVKALIGGGKGSGQEKVVRRDGETCSVGVFLGSGECVKGCKGSIFGTTILTGLSVSMFYPPIYRWSYRRSYPTPIRSRSYSIQSPNLHPLHRGHSFHHQSHRIREIYREQIFCFFISNVSDIITLV